MKPADDEDEPERILDDRALMRHGPPQTSLVVVHASRNPSYLGRRFVLDPSIPDLTVGRHSSNTFVLDVEGLSRRHARFEPLADVWWVLDSKSTNGTYLNGAQVKEAILHDGALLQLGGAIALRCHVGSAEEAFVDEVYTLSVKDRLTGLSNRRYLREVTEQEMMRARTQGSALSLLILDLDHFKRINDTRGHLVGDAVLVQVAEVLPQRMRGGEVAARYGGEEFAVLLPGTDLDGARARAEELRAAIGALRFTAAAGQTFGVTASVGVVAMDATTRTYEEFMARADAMLFEAKRDGRDRVRG